MNKFNLYDEPSTKSSTSTSDSFLDIDMSEPETLFSMSKKVRDYLSDKPDDFELTIYLVCGNTCSRDAGLFADYLKDVSQPILIAFRGIIHFDFIHMFFDRVVYVNQTSQLRYSKDKLHDTLKNFLNKPDSYKRFMQRFIDEYWKLNDGNLLPVSELKSLGIETQII